MEYTSCKTRRVFLPAELLERARSNCLRLPWAATMRQAVVDRAGPWAAMDEQALWELMFGPMPQRSWNVWYNGRCPLCGGNTPMYTWRVEPFKHPWKVLCPHCNELFPRNDFAAYYRSGLGRDGLFDPALANRALLVNPEHPDASDPKHGFCVDDGWGWRCGAAVYRFVGYFMIRGRWKEQVLGGIAALAEAYILTGERHYARKAAVLLDRVADVYPSCDFKTQAIVNEGRDFPSEGFVSMWHDACPETQDLAVAYDAVFEAIDDRELVAFLSDKSRQCGLANPKASAADIRRNIEQNILREALDHRQKIHCNFPRTDIACATMKIVLGWPNNRREVLDELGAVIDQATAVDGVTGEKGLAGYASFVISGMASGLARLVRFEPAILDELLQRHAGLRRTWRFWIDTCCLQKYYPTCGDDGYFAGTHERYPGAALRRPIDATGKAGGAWPVLEASLFSFLWRVQQATDDPALAQVLYHANGNSTEHLPWDAFAADAAAVQKGIEQVVERHGPHIDPASVNLQQWHLAIMRSGAGTRQRAAWVDYDSGGKHGHYDAMNLGLYAFGLDLMPDMGYPPIQFMTAEGGPASHWYHRSASHNTVVVDGQNPKGAPNYEFARWHGDIVAGTTTLWADGSRMRGTRISGPRLYEQTKQYERTVLTVDLDDDDFYLIDIFRVVGGREHVRFTHSHFATMQTEGLTLADAQPFGRDTIMRDYRSDPAPPLPWSADWQIDDYYRLLPEGVRDVHLRMTDFTPQAEACICQAWVVAGMYNSNDEKWIPRVMVRRLATDGRDLATTFVSVLEPYQAKRRVKAIRRLDLKSPAGARYGPAHVSLEIEHADGGRDLVIAADAENPLATSPSLAADGELIQKEWHVRLAGELAFIRRGPGGQVAHIAVGRTSSIRIGERTIKTDAAKDLVELSPGGSSV